MLKKLFAGAIALAGFSHAAADTETTEQDRDLACVEYTSEWVKFDLRPLEKADGTYF